MRDKQVMKDPARALRWTQRADDWARIAEHARETVVRNTCHSFAQWAYDMAEFFGGVA